MQGSWAARGPLTVTHLVPVLGPSTRSSAEHRYCFMVPVGSFPVECAVSAQLSTPTKISNICVTSPEFRVFAKVDSNLALPRRGP